MPINIYQFCILQNALGAEKVVYRGENFLQDYGEDGVIDAATREAKDADACILFLGTSAINPHVEVKVSPFPNPLKSWFLIKLKMQVMKLRAEV